MRFSLIVLGSLVLLATPSLARVGSEPVPAATPGASRVQETTNSPKVLAQRRGGAVRARPAFGGARPAFRPARPAFRPGAQIVRPNLRPNRPGFRPNRPGLGPNRPGFRPRPPILVKPWRPRPHYGRVFGGVVLGTIIAAAVAGSVPAAPAPDLCWYWTNSWQTQGYWDYCQY
jgi:hypothetical protein